MFRQVLAYFIALTLAAFALSADALGNPKTETSSTTQEKRGADDRKASLAKIDAAIKRTSEVPQKIALRKMRKLLERKNAPTALDLSNQKLTQLPSEIGLLTNLVKLNLAGNELSTVPPEIGHLAKLQILNLSRNRLKSLPEKFAKLTNLTSLNLDRAEFGNLPPEIFDLKDFPSWPPEIWKLKNLHRLDLSIVKKDKIPPEIGKLSQLSTLQIFGRNEFVELPPEIWSGTKLERVFFHKISGSNARKPWFTLEITEKNYDQLFKAAKKATAAKEAKRAELVKLAGKWIPESAVYNGKAVPIGDIKRKLRIRANAILEVKNDFDPDVWLALFDLDATKSPKQLDLSIRWEKQDYNGLYELKDDKLSVCFIYPHDKKNPSARPKTIGSAKDTNQLLVILKRVKE